MVVAGVAVGLAVALLLLPLKAGQVPVLRQPCGSAASPGGAYNAEGGDCWGAVHGRRLEAALVCIAGGAAALSGAVLLKRQVRTV